MECYTSKEVREMFHINGVTLCLWRKANKIPYIQITPRKFLYEKDKINAILHKESEIPQKPKKKNVIYCRVSTQRQKQEMLKQKQLLLDYCNSQGYIIDDTYCEIASGMNEDRIEFNKLMIEVINGNIENIFITYKDRLTRFGFKYFENLFKHYDCNIVVLNNKIDEESFENELTNDIISIIHHFSMKMYSNRRKKYKLAKDALESK